MAETKFYIEKQYSYDYVDVRVLRKWNNYIFETVRDEKNVTR